MHYFLILNFLSSKHQYVKKYSEKKLGKKVLFLISHPSISSISISFHTMLILSKYLTLCVFLPGNNWHLAKKPQFANINDYSIEAILVWDAVAVMPRAHIKHDKTHIKHDCPNKTWDLFLPSFSYSVRTVLSWRHPICRRKREFTFFAVTHVLEQQTRYNFRNKLSLLIYPFYWQAIILNIYSKER